MAQNDFNNNSDFAIPDEIYLNYGSSNDNELPIPRQPITMQPQILQNEFPGSRQAIPVSTVDWQSTTRSQFIPINGLDFLIGVASILIQQTVELGDMMSSLESENRYIMKVPGGETLYMATELSSPLQRLMCGAKRGCTISMADHTRQEALTLTRRMAFASCCFPCRLQEMQVLAPPGEYLGRIVQVWTMNTPLYLIKDNNDELLFLIEGPAISACCGKLDVEFKILSGDSMTQQGTISHRWEETAANFIMKVTFPTMAADPKVKALVIGAAFLLEYTYFVQGKSTKCLSICC